MIQANHLRKTSDLPEKYIIFVCFEHFSPFYAQEPQRNNCYRVAKTSRLRQYSTFYQGGAAAHTYQGASIFLYGNRQPPYASLGSLEDQNYFFFAPKTKFSQTFKSYDNSYLNLYKNQRRLGRIVVALSCRFFYFSSNINVFYIILKLITPQTQNFLNF